VILRLIRRPGAQQLLDALLLVLMGLLLAKPFAHLRDPPGGMAARRRCADPKDLPDGLECQIAPIAQVEDLALTWWQPVDFAPHRQELVPSVDRRGWRHELLDELLPATAQPMAIHGQAVGRPEDPGRRIGNAGPRLQLAPQPQQRLLHDLIGLIISKPQAASEPPHLLTELCMQILDDATVGSVR
jgi:hypothetical protein